MPSNETPQAFREYRNSRLYRLLARTLREYNRTLIDGLHARGFEDFSPSFPALLSNLDMEGTRIGVLARRAGVSRQAVGQLVREVERCGYIERRADGDDARATTIHFTARGRRLHATVVELVEEVERGFARVIGVKEFDAVRVGLRAIADQIDPGGALGVGDRASAPKSGTPRSPRRDGRAW